MFPPSRNSYCGESPTQLPYFAAALHNYDDTMEDHSKLSALQRSFDKDIYFTLKGGSVSRFHPRHLPAPLPTSTEVLDPESTKTCPNEGKLSMIAHHKAWHQQLEIAIGIDEDFPNEYKNREAVRHVSISQCGTGKWLETPIDNSCNNTMVSSTFETAACHRIGMPIPALVTINAKPILNGSMNYSSALGDVEANEDEHNRRHHGVNRKIYDMTSATAIGCVLMGDKGNEAKTKQFCNGKVTDVVHVGGAKSGKDLLIETKVPNPNTASGYVAGLAKGGNATSVGDLYGFGNTEEKLRIENFGVKQNGNESMRDFDHSTGKGYIKQRKGCYDDGLNVKKNSLLLAVVEINGGCCPQLVASIYRGQYLSKTKGRDRTRYSSHKRAPKKFAAHHLTQISVAAVKLNAEHINARIDLKKIAFMERSGASAGDTTHDE